MSLKTFVKVSNITNLSDARYCAGMGVNILGFSAESHEKDYLDPDKFVEISGWLSGVKYAAEFDSYSSEEIKKVLTEYSVHYIQVSNPAQVLELQDLNIPIVLKTNNLDEDLISRLREQISFFISSSTHMDSLTNTDPGAVVISGAEVTIETIPKILDLRFKGIELKGSEELKTGMGNFDKIADILESLELDD